MSNRKIIVEIDNVIAPLIPDFMKNRKEDIVTLTKALDNSDYETLRITGHNLKGCGTAYGFHDITNIGTCIEAAAVTQNSNEIKTQIDKLKTYLKYVEPRFN